MNLLARPLAVRFARQSGIQSLIVAQVSRRSSTSITTASSPTSPSAALKPECPAEAEVPAVLPEPDKVAAPPEPERPATTPEPEKPALAQWTDVQDALLKDLKQQGKTWKQIEEAIPSKDRGTLKERYKLLCIEQQKENVESSQEEKKDENGEAEQAGDEKGKAEAKSDNAKGAGKKSNLKESKGKPLEGSLKKVGDRPIIYLDFDDQLDAEQVSTPVGPGRQ